MFIKMDLNLSANNFLLSLAFLALILGVVTLYQHHVAKQMTAMDTQQQEGFATIIRRSASPTVVVSRPSTYIVSRPPIIVAGGGATVAHGALGTILSILVILLFVMMLWAPVLMATDTNMVILDDGPTVVYV
jgi:hypothetical protein